MSHISSAHRQKHRRGSPTIGEPDVFDYYSDSELKSSSKIKAEPALLILILLTLATATVLIQAHWLDNHTSYRPAETDIEDYLLSLTERPLCILIPYAYILVIVTLADRITVACSILSVVASALVPAVTVPLAIYVSRWNDWTMKLPPSPALFALSVAAAGADLRDKIKSVHERL